MGVCGAAGSSGERYGDSDEISWHLENSGQHPNRVGQKAPNTWGLHDVLGNVWEMVQDYYGRYPGGTVTDPRGPSSGRDRVLRGSSWALGPQYIRFALRERGGSQLNSDVGFRLVRTK